MNAEELLAQLTQEGFASLSLQEDPPHKFYPEHAHPTKTVQIVLQGTMWVTLNREKVLLTRGKRLDIPANAIHDAKMGMDGCSYVVGEE
ncbi:AraC family ligand binding domain-containing protein [Candidatus Woesearchaeota archaeon]|nr:AraC family ligand binding domain-containing protein [Candidatus Woesearchaeota archaeon]